MNHDLFAEVKSRVSVTDVLGRYYGVRDAVPGRNILCPFHRETHPSFGIARDNMHGKCFACGAGGDVFDLMLKHNGHWDSLDAAKTLAHDYGIPYEDDPEAVLRFEARQVNVEKLTKYALACHGHLTDEDRARLRQRGFSDEFIGTLRFGRHLPDKCPDHTWAKYPDAIVVPFWKGDTCSYAVLWRPVRPEDDKKKYVMPWGEFLRPPLIRHYGKGDGPFLIEGVFGYFSAVAADLPAIWSPGTNGWKAHEKDLERIGAVAIFDTDAAGQKAAFAYAERFYPTGGVFDLSPVLHEGQKDVNDIFAEKGPDGLREALSRAPRYDAVDLILADKRMTDQEKVTRACELATRHESHTDREAVIAKIKAAVRWMPKLAIRKEVERHTANAQDGEDERRLTQAEMLTQICEKSIAEYVQDQHGELYVLLPFKGHNELWPTTDGNFRRWMAQKYREDHGVPPSSEALNQAKLQVEAKCMVQPRRTLYNRVGWVDGKIVYDLTNDEWQGIEISREGWHVIDLPPCFRRHKHQQAQLVPGDGVLSDIEKLWSFVNVRPEKRLLALVTAASYFIPGIPHPILGIHGSPGRAKSSTMRRIKDIVDPSSSPLLSNPKDQGQAEHMLAQHWFAAFDNLGAISDWLSDTLCRAVTGHGSSQRKLYTDDEDFARSYQRCVAITTISIPAWHGDLLDRTILFELEAPEKRKTERDLDDEWRAAKAEILVAFLDAVVKALKVIDRMQKENLPRMADFALWGQALAHGFGYEPGEFLRSYADAISSTWEDAVEMSDLAQVVMGIVDESNGFTGSPSELFQKIMMAIPIEDRKKPIYPQSVKSLGWKLRDIEAALRSVGYEVSVGERGVEGRVYRLRKVARCEEQGP